jgi:hypothetical protein
MRAHEMMLVLLLAIGITACQSETTEPEPEASAPPPDSSAAESEPTAAADAPAAEISLGNGESNWVVVDGVTRAGDTLTFSEVQIDGNGWLVLHPFENGKPVGARYSGASYIESGKSKAVDIKVDIVPNSGDFFLVMLHRDVNENQEFDFVFVDERNVLDKAVFEGTMMIAHPLQVP